MVEGSGNLAAPVAALRDDDLVLASESDEVPLRVAAVHRGDWGAAEAILVPARELTEGTRYVLRAAAATPASPLDAWLHGSRSLAWSAVARIPDAPLRWSARPARGEAVVSRGCPAYAYLKVRVPIEHPEHLLGIVAEVRALQRGAKPRRFLVEAQRGEIALGHLGCSGPLVLERGVTHLVTFTAVDLAGRETPAPGGALVLMGPSQGP